MEEFRIDLRIPNEAREKEIKRAAELCFKNKRHNARKP